MLCRDSPLTEPTNKTDTHSHMYVNSQRALRLTEDSTLSLIIVLTSVMSAARKAFCEFHSYAKTCVIL